MDCEIANSGDRQIQLQRLPVIAIVKRYIDAEFGSGEEEAFGLRVFAHGAQECRRSDAVRDQLPGRAIVARSINVRRLIVDAAAIDGCISDSRIEMRSLDQRYLGSRRSTRRRDIFPVLSAIASQVNQPCVASHPDQIAISGDGAIVNTTP